VQEQATATLEPAVTPKERRKSQEKPKRQPRYNVILWDSDDHTYEYVILMLAELFRYPLEQGYQMACEVDKSGRAIVLTTTREHAELKRDQIHAFGKDARLDRCQGSMKASIEPVPGED
jgi:ATP-dependent Clp protease adaptor protein ClpS